jgi:3-dehydroquinate dehydratase II
MPKILILNGPNLGRLGHRQPEIYGTQTLTDLETFLRQHAEKGSSSHPDLEFFQTNHEGALIDRIEQACTDGTDGLIVNPGAWTHTSIALFDALHGANLPTIEVHLSNIHAREDFRRHSCTAPAAKGIIAGLGFHGYAYALDFLLLEIARK